MPSKEYYRTHREKCKEQQRQYYQRNKEEIKKRIKEYSQTEKAKEKARARRARWREKNREYIRKHNKEYARNIRFMLLAVYSNGQPECACCGENYIEFLTIDHIKGKGEKYGKGRKLRTLYELFRFLQKRGFPEGYRVLCYNCNCSLGHHGYCPHEIKRKYKDQVSSS